MTLRFGRHKTQNRISTRENPVQTRFQVSQPPILETAELRIHADKSITESSQKHRIHSVFSTSRRKFVIDYRPAEIGVHGSRVQVHFRDLTRGTSDTLMMGESTGGRDMNFAWMRINFIPTYWNQADGEPHNPSKDDRNVGPYAFSSFHAGGYQFALGDGSVRFVSENIDANTFWAISAMSNNWIHGEF